MDVIEGEIVEIEIDKRATGAMAKSGRITIKTTEMETIFELGAKMIQSLNKENVSAGDIVTIDKQSGKVTHVGKSFSHAHDYDATAAMTKFIHCPAGELQKHKK